MQIKDEPRGWQLIFILALFWMLLGLGFGTISYSVAADQNDSVSEICRARIVTPALREQAISRAAAIWCELVEKPFEISDYHREIIAYRLYPFGVSTAEEYVRKYARNMLRHIS